MANVRRISGEVQPPQSIEEARLSLDEAQQAFDSLVAERRLKRETLPRSEWRKYNIATQEAQLEVQERLKLAAKAHSRLAARSTRHVAVNGVAETNVVGGG